MVIGNIFLRPVGSKRQSRALVVGSSLHNCLECNSNLLTLGKVNKLTLPSLNRSFEEFLGKGGQELFALP